MEPPEPASTASTTSTSTKPTRNSSAADRNSKLAGLLASIEADLDLELTAKAAAAPSTDDASVNSFRRAKFFFPKVVEEQRKAQEAREAAAARKNKGKAKELKPALRSSTPDRSTDHDTKRRKVSHESHQSQHDSDDDENAKIKARLTARGGSRSSTSSPLNSPARQARRSPIDSLSPSPPRPRLDKGKGKATQHSVSAQVAYTNASSPPSKSTRQQTKSTRSTAKGKDASVVVIDSTDDSDSDDDVKPYRPPERRAPPPPRKKKEEVAEAVDPEFAEYIQRAREKAAKAKKEAEIEAVFGAAGETDVSDAPAPLATFSSNTTTTTTNPTTASQTTTASMGRYGSNLAQSGSEQATPTAEPTAATPPRTVIPSSQPAPDDQQYRVFITSHLPQECPPLMAFMRMDQEMRHARIAYLSHATKHNVHLTDDETQSVLLTWKGSKIYNFTTGQSLNVKPDHKGRFRDFASMMSNGDVGGSTTSNGPSTAGFQNGGLHLEIWTQQLYDAYLEEEDRRHRRNLGELVELSDDDDGVAEGGGGGGGGAGSASRGTSQAPDAAAAASSTRIRLVLASREYEKLKITAHSDTTVETLATAFRLQRGIEPDKTVAIMWDGDELEGSMTVGEAEMEDLDGVEVYIR
ncbi:hypothetical protein Sste5346_005630 [Sporothrix stenoceras]|uniref:Ubiquitin-like domain-containing protein n=1 Tax=Sporothrix stenoceras TaxID=5173 RepID=A0ABR3Z557_9PEZI